MGILSWLRGEHIENTVRRAHQEHGFPLGGLGETELQQARILDGMSRRDAEHCSWTGLNLDIPVIDYEDASDRWARERQEKGH